MQPSTRLILILYSIDEFQGFRGLNNLWINCTLYLNLMSSNSEVKMKNVVAKAILHRRTGLVTLHGLPCHTTALWKKRRKR
jgi:hypothetical protein